MRLLTHNTLQNNAHDVPSENGGYPLKITATEVRVDDASDINDLSPERQEAFVKGVLGMLDWNTLVQGASDMGLKTLPPTLTEELASDSTFLRALYHVLMNVHLVRGILTCPDTGREFPVSNGIADFMLEEDECEHVRMS